MPVFSPVAVLAAALLLGPLAVSVAHAAEPAPREAQQGDAALRSIITSRLQWSSQTYRLPIEVDSRDGVVTLRGRVTSADAKQMAGELAEATAGVHLVNNLISLGVSDPAQEREQVVEANAQMQNDAWIEEKVHSSLIYSRNLETQNIEVNAEEGVVRLSGEVASAEQKTLAVQVAQQIRGVRGVDADKLKVAAREQD